jgi:hypothetical protein
VTDSDILNDAFIKDTNCLPHLFTSFLNCQRRFYSLS